MSKAQGQFTIIDYNDALTLTGYIGSNHPKTQMFNPDNSTYNPDWSKNNLVLTPSLYVIGTTTDQITSSAVTSVKWYEGNSTTPITSAGNYALSGSKSHILTVKANTMAGLPGIDYRCEITYHDETTGLSITHPLSITFSRVVNGVVVHQRIARVPRHDPAGQCVQEQRSYDIDRKGRAVARLDRGYDQRDLQMGGHGCERDWLVFGRV